MSDLAWLSASDALDLFGARDLSPVDLAKAVIARAEATDPGIKAFTYCDFEAALAAARRAETRYMGKGDAPRALEGLCIAVKDSGDVAGQPTSAGSLLSDDVPKTVTSPLNQRVLDAGGIVHARSATPEYSCASVTWSKRRGVTRNPWNLAVTPGGSSGGAAAALAAGSATLATGSDIAGSIRIPASCCGVVGYKPPRGRNPVDPPFNLDFCCHTGPMARTVADAMLFQNVLCGPHPGDPTLLPRHDIVARTGSLAGLRVALSLDLGFHEVTPEVIAATRSAARLFRDLGARVEDIALPWDAGLIEAAMTHLRMIFGASIAPEFFEDREKMTDYARDFAEAGLKVSPRDYFAALTRIGEAGVEFGHAMRGYDLLICPTTALPALPADFDPAHDPLQINGRAVDPMLGWALTVPFNLLGTHPVLSLPSGRSEDGVPIGLQIVGRPFDDNTVFRAALAFETARGPWFTDGATRPALPRA